MMLAVVSKTQTSWKTIEIVNAVLHECIYFFTIIIIVTNPKCHVTQQSRIDNCRQVKKVSYIFIQNKNENDKNNGKIISLLACDLWKKKKDLNSQDSATIDVIQIYRLLRSMRDRPQLLRGGRG